MMARAVPGALAALLVALSGAAHAHAYLVRSEPPAHAVVAKPPPRLRLSFSEPLEPSFIELVVQRDGTVLDAADKPQLSADGKTLLWTLADRSPGVYSVAWRIVAKDGHPTQGRLAFTVKPR